MITEYEPELDKLNYEHNQKIKEILNELNNKDISINKYKQIIKALENNEKISPDGHKKEIQKLKEELKKSKEYVNIDKNNKHEILKKKLIN